MALLLEVLPPTDEAFRQALDHSEETFRLLDAWAGYRCLDALRAGVPQDHASRVQRWLEEYLLARLLTSPVEGQQQTSLPLLKALLLVGVIEGRPELQLMKDLASGAVKARRPGTWRRVTPRPLAPDAGLAKSIAHCLGHARDQLELPAGRSDAERQWLADLERWCRLLQAGTVVRRRPGGLPVPRPVVVGTVASRAENPDEGLAPPPAIVVRYVQDDPPPTEPGADAADLLAPSELPEASFTELQASPRQEGEPETREAGEARCARSGFRSALENQFLPWTNRQLIPDDRDSLVAAVKRDLVAGDAVVQDTVGVLGLAHVTGQLVEQAVEITRVPADDRSYLSGRTFMRYVPPQEGAWAPDAQQALLLRPRATHIPLSLPGEIADWLDRRWPAGSRAALAAELGLTPVAARSLARGWLASLRESTGGLQSLSRVEWWLPQAIYQPGRINTERADHVRPHLVCAVTDGQPCPAAYYRAYEAGEISALYREVLADAGWTIDASEPSVPAQRRWVGTRLNLEFERVRGLWAGVTRHFQERVQDHTAPLHVRHNARELYECFSLVFQTLHRIVSDPIESLEFVDLQTRRIVIDDKSQGEARAHRLIPLTRMAVAQCEDQIEHIRRLSVAVSPSAPTTAQTLMTMLEHPQWRVAPFRFLLNERLEIVRITPSVLLAELEGVWGFPLNLARHFSSTWLLENGASDEALRSLLGHHDLGTQNLSLYSPRSFDDLYKTLLPLLDQLVSELRLQAIPTFLPAVPAGAGPSRARARPAGMAFGYLYREQARARRFAAIDGQVQGWIQEQLGPRSQHELTQGDVDALFNRVRKETANHRSYWASVRGETVRAALVDILRKHADLKLDLPAIALTIKDVAHVCPMDGLTSARWLTQLRASLQAFWAAERQGWRAAGAQGYVASAEAVVLTLIVDSLVIDPEIWKRWLATGRGLRLFVDEHERSWIRLPLSNQNTRLYPVRREVAELIAGVPVDDWVALDLDRVAVLANAMSAAWRGSASVADFWQLLKRVQGGSAAQMPGLVLGFADGSHRSVSPEDLCLERCAGQPPTVGSVEAWHVSKQSSEALDAIGVGAGASQSGKGGLTEVSEFRQRVSTALQTMNRQANTECDKPRRRGAKQSDFTAIMTPTKQATPGRGPGPIRRFIESMDAQWDELVDSPALGPVCGLSARWLRWLAAVGKDDGDSYAPKTLRNYWYSWGLRVVEEFGPIHPRDLSPAECEELYLQIVEDADVDNRQHLYAPMRSLHRYLVAEHGVPEIEWSELRQATDQGLTHVDANLVFHAEYLRALDLLLNDPAVSARVRALQATVLVLVYRFGLRIAECLGLRESDVVLDAKSGRWVVRVRGNQYRTLKTSNARRTVVALEDLGDVEQGVLNAWSSHVAAFAASGEVAPLFASAATGQRRTDLFPRRVVALRVAQAMRIATGDPSVRIHHCRHTYATRILNIGLGFTFGPTSEAASVSSHRRLVEQVRKTLTHEIEPTRRLIWAVAVALGHSSPLTELETYCHLGHEWLLDWCDRHLWSLDRADTEVLAWAAGITRKTMQRDAQRHKDLDAAQRRQRALTSWSRIVHLGQGPRVVRETHLPPLKLVEGGNTLVSADRIVDHARRHGRVDGLSQALFVSELWIEQVLLAARDFAARHRSARTPQTQWWLEGSEVCYPEHEGEQIDLALEKLERLDPGRLRTYGEILERYLAPAARMVVIERADVLEPMSRLAKLLVDEPGHVQLLLPAKLPRRLTPVERELRDKEARRRAEALNRPYRPRKPRLQHEAVIDAEGIEALAKLARQLGLRVDAHGRVAGTRDAAHDWLNPGARVGLRIKENAVDVMRSAKVFTRVLSSVVVACKALSDSPEEGAAAS